MIAPCSPRPTAVARWTRQAAVAAALCFLAVPAHAQWGVTPYLWASSVDATVTVADRPAVDEHIPFTDLLEDLDAGLLLRVEAQYGEYGGMLDLFYVHMSDTDSDLTLPGGVPATLDSKIGMAVIDATGSYDPHGDGRGIAFVAGARVLVQSATLDLAAQGAPATQHSEMDDVLVDAVVGLRYRTPLASHWSLDVRGDIGTGGAPLTWSAGADVAYLFGRSQRFAVSAGYRYLAIQFEDGTPVQVDMAMSGFLTGFRIAL